MILIYSEQTSPRFIYACNFIFIEMMGIEYRITMNQDEFNSYQGMRLFYGKSNHPGSFPFIESSGLVFEKGINSKINIEPQYIKGVPVLFITNCKFQIVPFDIFSAVFFMLSRYEEYLPFVPDRHGRFEAEASRLYFSGFIKIPLVNIWINLLIDELKRVYPRFQPPFRKFDFHITFDIDSAWAFKNRGILRSLGGYFNSLKRGNTGEIIERTLVLSGNRPDPFDNFNWISDTCRKYSINPIYFFLVGNFSSYNKNISPANPAFQQLIKNIHESAQVGLHPSYGTSMNSQELKRELEILSSITGNHITRSRQHFLKLKLPDTYRILNEHGIKEDYTLGFAGQTGYRAGVSAPFFFYDLPDEKVTSLRIFPLTIMDGTLKDYLGLNPDEAIDTIKSTIRELKSVNGTFIGLWHNESLSDSKRWKGWRRVFEEIVDNLTI